MLFMMWSIYIIDVYILSVRITSMSIGFHLLIDMAAVSLCMCAIDDITFLSLGVYVFDGYSLDITYFYVYCKIM
jgi:hypothetical protein